MLSDQGGVLFVIITVVGVIALGAALMYAMSMWRTKRRDPATEKASREATKAMYHHEDAEAEARAEGRPTVETTAVDSGVRPS